MFGFLVVGLMAASLLAGIVMFWVSHSSGSTNIAQKVLTGLQGSNAFASRGQALDALFTLKEFVKADVANVSAEELKAFDTVAGFLVRDKKPQTNA